MIGPENRHIVLLAAQEFVAQILNLPPGAIVDKIEWEDRRRLYRFHIKSVPFGTPEGEPPMEHDARVDNVMHHIVNWPVGMVHAPTLTVKAPPINLGQVFEPDKIVDLEAVRESGKANGPAGKDGVDSPSDS
jgi:hypothetical protein